MYMYYFLGHQLMDNPSLTDAQKEVSQVIEEEGNCWLYKGESGKYILARPRR